LQLQKNINKLIQGGKTVEKKKTREIEMKITDDILMGRYANIMRVTHSSEEFLLEFANAIPPVGAVVARVFISPGHLKRIIKALSDNLERYEKKFGEVKEAEEPERRIGF